MVAEDDAVIADSLAAILKLHGLAVLCEADGRAALETARLIPPEILIAELSLPGMSGLELAAEIARTAPDCNIILFAGPSAIVDPPPSLHELACTFSVLIKPVHPADLLDLVRRLLARSGRTLTPPSSVQGIRPSENPLPRTDPLT